MAKFTAGEVQAAMENVSTDGDERSKAVRALTVAWLFDFSAWGFLNLPPIGSTSVNLPIFELVPSRRGFPETQCGSASGWAQRSFVSGFAVFESQGQNHRCADPAAKSSCCEQRFDEAKALACPKQNMQAADVQGFLVDPSTLSPIV